MTNAEKLAKNTDAIVRLIRLQTLCDTCPVLDYCAYHQNDGKVCAQRAKEWLESEVEEEELAIWKYDNFPYMKIGKVKYKNADGTVEVKGYDGMRFMPMKIIPYDETLISKFNIILEGHRKAEKEADKRTLCNLRTLLGFESKVKENAEIH